MQQGLHDIIAFRQKVFSGMLPQLQSAPRIGMILGDVRVMSSSSTNVILSACLRKDVVPRLRKLRSANLGLRIVSLSCPPILLALPTRTFGDVIFTGRMFYQSPDYGIFVIG